MSGSSPLPGEPGSQSCVFYPYPAVFILFMHMGEAVACTTIVVMLGVKMADDIIYRGLSPVGNLTNHKPA